MYEVESNTGTPVTTSGRGRPYSLSPTRDVPILQLVRDSTYITRPQVERLLPSTALLEDWTNRNKRLRRLVQLDQLHHHGQMFPYQGQVYSITRAGLGTLETVGRGIHSVTSETDLPSLLVQALHFLGLNEVRASLLKVFTIEDWYGDRMLKSLNILAPNPTAKDYDSIAVVATALPQTHLRVGIEYERTIKSQTRYAEIRKILDTEKQIDVLMYFTENAETANIMASLVYSTALRVCAVDAPELAKSGAECTVFTVRDRKVMRVPIKQFLPDVFV
jgi:hypothetical protein